MCSRGRLAPLLSIVIFHDLFFYLFEVDQTKYNYDAILLVFSKVLTGQRKVIF